MRTWISGLTAAALLAAGLLAAPPAGAAGTVVGSFSQNCDYSHNAPVDPIVAPGGTSMHNHEFFGNEYTDANSTPSTLRVVHNYDDTSCDRIQNRSAYWAPTLLVPPLSNPTVPQRLKPNFTRVYYRDGGIADTDTIEVFNQNHTMIAGDALHKLSDPDQDQRVVQWGCVQEHDETVQSTTIPTACPKVEGAGIGVLRMRVTFPNCWDGNSGPLGFPKDQSHMRYSWQNADRTLDPSANPLATCPTGFNHPLPEIEMGVRWNVDGLNLTLARLASDGMLPNSAIHGRTAHADFMNGWNQTALTTLITNCIKAHVICGAPSGPVIGDPL